RDHRDPVLDHRCLVRLPRSGTVLRRVDRDMNRPALARAEDFSGRRVLVAGLGVSGRSAAQVATELGARVTGADCDPRAQERDLPAGVDVIAEADPDRLADRALANGPDLIVASPGWNPRTPLLARAQAEVISEVELAWRIEPPQVPWLTLTGTNGKTTTVGMLAAILQAHGWHAQPWATWAPRSPKRCGGPAAAARSWMPWRWNCPASSCTTPPPWHRWPRPA